MSSSQLPMVTAQELSERLSSARPPLLLDVLPEEVFAERRIPGARNVCVYEMVFLDRVTEFTGGNLETPVVVYGEATGEGFGAGQEAVARLAGAGYRQVEVLEGGIQTWLAARLPVEGHGQAPWLPDGVFPLDAEASLVDWVGRNLANKHWGTLRPSSGALEFKEGLLRGGQVVLDMTSMACSDIADSKLNQLLLAHLRSTDFFETERFPEATFGIRSCSPIPGAGPGAPNTHIVGSFELRGVTREIAFDAVVATSSGGEVVAQAVFEIDRTRWGIRYGSGRVFERLGKHLVNDLIGLQLKIVVGRADLTVDSRG